VAPLFTVMPEAHRALGEIAAFIVDHTAPRTQVPAVEGNPAVTFTVRSVIEEARSAS
jgi:hypothetical protein